MIKFYPVTFRKIIASVTVTSRLTCVSCIPVYTHTISMISLSMKYSQSMISVHMAPTN